LREALARSDHDFVLSEPRSRSTGRRSEPRPEYRASAGSFLFRCLRLAYRAAAYPNRVAGALLIVVLIAILINALVLQRSPHPAPLFGRTIQVPAASTPAAAPAPPQAASQAAAAIEKPEPAAAPSSAPDMQKPARDPIAQLLKGGGSSSPPHQPSPIVSLRKHTNQEAAASETKPMPPPRDQISQLLKGNAPSSAGPAPAEPSKTVLAVQHALVKLGFVLKPDGVNGAATRQALEQFEHDHNLPAKGELTPKVLRELATQSGQTIE
jgi:Putative peptidoglycan binding domain